MRSARRSWRSRRGSSSPRRSISRQAPCTCEEPGAAPERAPAGAASEDVTRAARRDRPTSEPVRVDGKKVDRHDTRRPPAAVEPTPRTARPLTVPAKATGKSKKEDDPDGTLPLAD